MLKKPVPHFITDTSEKALQRAILWKGNTILGSKTTIQWLDIELPVDDKRGGRGHCVDLIGKLGNRYVLCELKFYKKGAVSDSPEYAMNEIKYYHEAIKRNWKTLDTNDELHHAGQPMFKWKDLASDSTILMVAANSSYWAYWCGSWSIKKSHPFDIPPKMMWCSIDVPCDLFNKQKGERHSYEPSYEACNWNILIK